jgi:pimeloyl-ACP methyl ester carboxylesterase
VVEALIDGAMSGDIALHEIGAPTLLVVGSEDLLTPVHSHKELAARLPRSEILVIKGGHASLLEHPEEMPRVLEALANLLWREGRPSYREVRV